jgi:hypothetical protein
VDEPAAQRRQLKADPDTRRRRRRTVIIALVQLPVAILLINLSLHVRFALGTKAEVIQTESSQPREPVRASLGRLTMAASGLGLLGVSFLLLARSPFRMPPGERLFRLVWLGPPGRWFVRFSSRGVAPPATGKTLPGRTRANASMSLAPRAAAPTAKPAPPDRMGALEARVDALEKWRDGARH